MRKFLLVTLVYETEKSVFSLPTTYPYLFSWVTVKNVILFIHTYRQIKRVELDNNRVHRYMFALFEKMSLNFSRTEWQFKNN